MVRYKVRLWIPIMFELVSPYALTCDSGDIFALFNQITPTHPPPFRVSGGLTFKPCLGGGRFDTLERGDFIECMHSRRGCPHI